MTKFLTVVALDTGPVLGLWAFASRVALVVAVAAAEDLLLGTLTGNMANLLAVVARTSAAAARVLRRLGTLELAVTTIN
jgi:hypothetical protein